MLCPRPLAERKLKAIIGPLAFALTMSVSHVALANCNPPNSGDTSVISTFVGGDVNCGPADDNVTVTVTGTISGNLNTNGGEDAVTINIGAVNGDVNTGNANDTVDVINGGKVGRDVSTGAGGDIIEVDGGLVGRDIDAGDGDNEITIEGEAPPGQYTVGRDVITGTGNDTITIDEEASVGRNVVTGDGNDQVIVNEGDVEGSVRTGTGDDTVTINAGGEVAGNVNTDGGIDTINLNGGEVGGNIIMGGDGDTLVIKGGEVGGDITTNAGADEVEVDLSGGGKLELKGTVLDTGAGSDELTIIGANNLEDDEGNLEIENAAFELNGGDGRDELEFEDSEIRLGVVTNFELLKLEESVVLLTEEEYEFGEPSDPAFNGMGDQIRGINIDGASQLWFTEAEDVEATHIEIGGPSGDASLKVSNQYAAFDPGGMLMFGAFPAEEGDDDDDEGGEAGEPVNTVLNIGDSTLVNNGTVGTLNGIVGDTVTVNGGPYIAASPTAKMVIDTQLGGSNSPTDRFNFTFAGLGGPVQGNTTTVYVNNVGGIGGFTGQGPTDGIVIVSAPAGFAPNAFQLGVNQLTGKQEVLAGAFSYRLFNSPTAALLQSDILDQVPGYAIVSSVAQRYASAGLGTLYKRMGEVRLGRGDGKTIGNAGAGMWVRGFYNDSDVSPETGFAFSQENQGVMGGADIDLGSSAGGHFLAGAFGGYGTADAGTSAKIWGVNSPSTVDLTAYTFGFYGSYYDVGRPGTGLYVDGVFKVDITDFDIASAVRASSASTDGYTSTVSGETGYGFNLGGNLTLQPQAQLSYISVSNQNYQDNLGVKVGSGVGESLVGRASLQLQGNYGSASGGWFAPYAIASVLSDFLGDNETVIGRTPFKNDMGLTWYEAGGGVTAELGEFVSLYGSAEYSFGDIEGWGGTGGVKARW